jgi:hypothetical protein
VGGLDDPRRSRQRQLTSHRRPDPNDRVLGSFALSAFVFGFSRGLLRCQPLFLVFRGDFSASRCRAFDSSPITFSEPFVALVCLCLQSTPKTIVASRRVTSRGLSPTGKGSTCRWVECQSSITGIRTGNTACPARGKGSGRGKASDTLDRPEPTTRGFEPIPMTSRRRCVSLNSACHCIAARSHCDGIQASELESRIRTGRWKMLTYPPVCESMDVLPIRRG